MVTLVRVLKENHECKFCNGKCHHNSSWDWMTEMQE